MMQRRQGNTDAVSDDLVEQRRGSTATEASRVPRRTRVDLLEFASSPLVATTLNLCPLRTCWPRQRRSRIEDVQRKHPKGVTARGCEALFARVPFPVVVDGQAGQSRTRITINPRTHRQPETTLDASCSPHPDVVARSRSRFRLKTRVNKHARNQAHGAVANQYRCEGEREGKKYRTTRETEMPSERSRERESGAHLLREATGAKLYAREQQEGYNAG